MTKELDEAEKSPSSPKKKSVDALDDGSSDRKHKLLAVDRKSHKELVGLFYSLNQVSSYLTKTVFQVLSDYCFSLYKGIPSSYYFTISKTLLPFWDNFWRAKGRMLLLSKTLKLVSKIICYSC